MTLKALKGRWRRLFWKEYLTWEVDFLSEISSLRERDKMSEDQELWWKGNFLIPPKVKHSEKKEKSSRYLSDYQV